MIEKNAVKREILIHASVEKVWRALTVPEELNRWYTEECEIDFRVGGSIKMVHGWGAWTSGTITEIVENEKFVFRTGDDSLTKITLAPEDNEVKVAIEYQGTFFGNEGQGIAENMAFGTYQFLRNMKSVLEEGIDIRPTLWPTTLGVFHTSVRPDHQPPRGALVLDVPDNSPAKDCGLLPGDIITKAGSETIRSYEDLEYAVWKVDPDQLLELDILRDEQEKKLECRVTARLRA